MRIFGMWRKRWLFVKDSCVGYFGEDGEEIRCVLLMDQGFKVAAGVSPTGSNSGLSISNLSRQMIIKGWTRRKAAEWLDCIEKAMTTTGNDQPGSLKRIPLVILITIAGFRSGIYQRQPIWQLRARQE